MANSAYYILNTILKMDNEVPKILATKYFLEVMNKEVSEEKDYKIIYYIYVLAILFVTTQGKKAYTSLGPRTQRQQSMQNYVVIVKD